MFKDGGKLDLNKFSANGFKAHNQAQGYGYAEWNNLTKFLSEHVVLLDGQTIFDPYSDIIEYHFNLLALVAAHITGDASFVSRSEAYYRKQINQFEKAIVAVNPYKFVADNINVGRESIERILYTAINNNWDNRDELIDALRRSGKGMILPDTLLLLKSDDVDVRCQAAIVALEEINAYYQSVDKVDLTAMSS